MCVFIHRKSSGNVYSKGLIVINFGQWEMMLLFS